MECLKAISYFKVVLLWYNKQWDKKRIIALSEFSFNKEKNLINQEQNPIDHL